ncbi:TIGR03986 family type III CRISPR-associated RAMP protein [Vibrio sp. WXL210]|uniref:TIGR03986 family type III CRISPR-associated RAMP protein n=1 Tax=Vibrio sp. WXL210 TaxID=3450709 RepID=UPI003EC632CC
MAEQMHAPYHFVPLSKWVYMPEWAHLVSHDHPFSDGHSGVLEYTLTNHTALCVGDQPDSDESSYVPFVKDPQNRPIIPGSSLKGMLRNVMEIASFAKFGSIDDRRFAYRDISHSRTKYAEELRDTKAQAYWLKYCQKRQAWTFRKARHTVIFHDDLNLAYNTAISNVVFKNEKGTRKKNLVPTQEKYAKFPLAKRVTFSLGQRSVMGTKGNMVTVDCATKLKQGELSGSVAFSGFRPGKDKDQKVRLNFSYVFFAEAEETQLRPTAARVVQDFFDNHDSDLIDYLQQNPHPDYGIPVFARESKNGDIVALGVAKMPKKSYQLATQDLLQQNQSLALSPNTFDLAELMFGTLREHGFSLKSRVLFSDANCTRVTSLSKSAPVVLSSPKASFLAGYIEQADERVAGELANYQTGSRLKGWKRYPRQASFSNQATVQAEGNEKMQASLELMAPNAQFSGKILFHNLKTEELGALLWCMQLGQHQADTQHSLGHGKPLGAGQVSFSSIQLTSLRSNGEGTDQPAAITAFVNTMEQAYPGDSWSCSPQVQHLLEMSKANDAKLEYMDLETYSYHQKGNTKQTLPKWNHLERNENLKQDQISSFARGRLANLFDKHREAGYQVTAKESDLFGHAEQLAEKEKFASLSKVAQAYATLCEKLAAAEVRASKERRQGLNAELESLLALALEEDFEYAEELLVMCQDTQRTAYLDLAKNPKNKKKLAQRKATLAKLAQHYGLEYQ